MLSSETNEFLDKFLEDKDLLCLGTISSGLQSIIKQVRRKRMGQLLALKVLKHGTESQFVACEVAIVRRLAHPNLVQVFDITKGPSTAILVMECLQRGDLQHYINAHGRFVESGPMDLGHSLSAVDTSHPIHSRLFNSPSGHQD